MQCEYTIDVPAEITFSLQIISGAFCECDNFSCDRYNGRLCYDHGTCECGQCYCHLGWSGPACNCPTTITTCISPIEDAGVCSAHVSDDYN